MNFAVDCTFESLQKLIARLISNSRKSASPFAVYGCPAGQLLATFKLQSVSYGRISDLRLGGKPQEGKPRIFLGALNYDGLAFGGSKLHKIYEVDGHFSWSHQAHQLRTTRKDVFDWLQGELEECQNLALDYLELVPGFDLLEEDTEEHYLKVVEQVIEEIKSGNFYQLNYLRYFKVKNLNWDQLLSRWFYLSGPQGALLIDKDLSLVSFSPETFVNFTNSHDGIEMTTYPIKGTSRRFKDKKKDLDSKRFLSESKKDLAELSMIVDLMRNDFNRIGKLGTVVVERPPYIHSFETVHHLISEVKGECSNDIKFDDFCKALFPAGSITGAPKVAVMNYIKEIENRPRNFFMGNFFWWNVGINFLSSVLIRTVEVDGDNWNEAPKEGSYAAGSGIVVKSEPVQELLEIQTKCKVLTEHLTMRQKTSNDR